MDTRNRYPLPPVVAPDSPAFTDPGYSSIEPAADWQRFGDFADISYDVADGIAKITINRPEKRNAFRPQTLFELERAFGLARDDDQVGVIILTGQGDWAFCSGGDQVIRGNDGYIGDDEVARKGIGRLNVLDLQIQIRRLPKPVIAMVAGYAIGGGHVLHIVCDLTIAVDGGKLFHPGGRVKGCYFGIGKPSERVIVCEGFATGASIHEATGDAVAVAFNAGNLQAVAQALHAEYPELTIVIAADDDQMTDGNPGLTNAKAAALAVGGFVVAPQFAAGRPAKATDFNDLAAIAGLGAVRACFSEIWEFVC